MNIRDMTAKQLREVPDRDNWQTPVVTPIHSLVFIPGYSRPMHDSGYRFIKVVAVDGGGEPICTLAGWSDALHIGGIGGGRFAGRSGNPTPSNIPWSMDCLPKSGFFRIWASGYTLDSGIGLSDFEIKVRNRTDA